MSEMAALVARLEAVADRLEKAGAGGGGGGDAGASVTDFDELLGGSFKTFLDLSASVGGDVATIAGLVETAFKAQREFLVMASKSQKPAASDMGALIKPTGDAMAAVSSFKEKQFRSKQGNHLSGVADAMSALAWVTMDKPCPYIKEVIGSGQFYTNRVLKEFKDSDKTQVEWCRQWTKVLNDLHDYVKQHHTTGVSWNPNGDKASAPAPTPKSTTTTTSAPKPTSTPAPTKPVADVKGGLFAALNKGGNVTSGLKKVDKSQMTHKNPALRGSAVVPASATAKKATSAPKKFGAAAVKKDPVLQLNGKKWVCEYQENNKEIKIETDGVNQTLYAYKCTGSTIQVKGKINAITLDACKKTAIVFDTCVAAFELINCQSVQVQVLEKVKTITVDKTDGCQVYLSKDSLDAEFVSAKSSEMNISAPIGDGDEFIEMAVPEQYKTTVNLEKKCLETGPTDIAG